MFSNSQFQFIPNPNQTDIGTSSRVMSERERERQRDRDRDREYECMELLVVRGRIDGPFLRQKLPLVVVNVGAGLGTNGSGGRRWWRWRWGSLVVVVLADWSGWRSPSSLKLSLRCVLAGETH